MNPKWNPITLMILGAALMVFAYTYEGVDIVLSYIIVSWGALTMASGVVLAYLQMFRDEPRPGRTLR